MGSEKRLLIIDDEIEVLNTLQRVFYKDYEMHLTQSPKEALLIMEKFDIGVILCDQRMPEMKGTEFFTIVKKLYPNAIRILITGYLELSDAIISINEGHIFRYITKPWHLSDLKCSVKEAFEKNALLRENLIMVEALKNTNITLKAKVIERTKELEEKNEELKKISKEKSEILGIVAHDLRSPVGGIFTLSKYVHTAVEEIYKCEQGKYEELKECLQFLRIITQSSKHLLGLINDILDVSAIETGKLVLHLENINYIPYLNKSIEIYKELAKHKGVIVLSRVEIKGDVKISIDKIKISQVINNFLENAIKYSYPLGKITLVVEEDEEYIITKVIDEGKGIPKSQRNKLFKLFSKTSTLPTGGEKSNGLGLYISKKIIEAHHGSIGFEDNTSGGSIFYFKLRKNS